MQCTFRSGGKKEYVTRAEYRIIVRITSFLFIYLFNPIIYD
jgi:hypothetical protein